MSSSKRRRRAPEKEIPGENAPDLVNEGQDACEDDDGFYDDVEEPLSAQCPESEETPSDQVTTVPGTDLVEP
jgi:hypothetical protein